MKSTDKKSLPGNTVISVSVSTKTLFEGRREIKIDHNGELYRLRITRNEKLILTK